jgi:lipid-binding SYLF domain-containing protein
MKHVTLATIAITVMAVHARAEITSSEAARLAAAARVVRDVDATIPREYWDRARCVAVIPELKKAALGIGGEYGKGVMSCRTGNGWSAPLFIQLIKGSWGFQAGAEQVDVVMLVMNEQGVQKLLQNKVTLGADASVAVGPVGRQGQVGTDAFLKAEILSYSKAQGLFAGIDLSGGVLRPDDDANRNAYGPGATPRTILASRDISAPPQAGPFMSALAAGPSAPAARTAESSTDERSAQQVTPQRPTTSAPPTTDSDLRTRLVDMQQMVNRLMADRDQAVATSGRDDRSVVVDRATMEQLRREIDAALAAVDKR